MTSPLSPLRWPGWHRMPQPGASFPVRWSFEAWETLYPLGRVPWKPWPHEPEPLDLSERQPFNAEAFWEFVNSIPARLPAPAWPELRTFVCPGCMRPQYERGYCGICRPLWIAAQAQKPYTLPPIIIL